MKNAKRSGILKNLAMLRKSEPKIPMVSSLDIGPESDNDPVPLNMDVPTDNEKSFEDSTDSTPSNWTQLICSTPNHDPEPAEQSCQAEHSLSNDCPVFLGQTFPKGTEQSLGSSSDPNSSITINEVFEAVKFCATKMEYIISKLDRLEQGLENLHNQLRTPVKPPKEHPSFNSPQGPEHVDKNSLSACLYETVLRDFEKYQLGPRTAKKDVDNAHQAMSHAKCFCMFMLGGLPISAGRRDLTFLNQPDKLQEFPWYLAKKGCAPSTISNILANVVLFLGHVETGFQKSSKLTETQLSKLCYEMKMVQAEVTKNMDLHSQKILPEKTEINPIEEDIKKFLTAARTRIPTLLQRLDKTPNMIRDHNKLMGYLIGYLVIISGHRSAVFTNMTKDHVTLARKANNKKRFHIVVDEDETPHGLGEASIVLTEEEYRWLDQLINTSCCDEASLCRFLFHTILGTQIYKPVIVLQEAWADSGLKGAVNFKQIRFSVSTQAKKNLSNEDGKKAKINNHKVRMKTRKSSGQSPTKEGPTNRGIELILEDEMSMADDTPTEDEEELKLDDEPDDISVISLSSDDEIIQKRVFARHWKSLKFRPESQNSGDHQDTKPCFVQLTRLSHHIVDECQKGRRSINLSKIGSQQVIVKDIPEPQLQLIFMDTLEISVEDIVVATTDPITEYAMTGYLEPSSQDFVMETPDHPAQVIPMDKVESPLENVMDTPEPVAQQVMMSSLEPSSQDVVMETPNHPAQVIPIDKVEPPLENNVMDTPEPVAQQVNMSSLEPSSQDVVMETPDHPAQHTPFQS